MSEYLKLCRAHFSNKQTIGSLYVIKDDKVIFGCFTLELPWKNNLPNISCIPAGKYKCHKYHSSTLGDVIAIEGVPGRTLIRIHAGNYHTQIQGCVLVGEKLKYINVDQWIDVANSKTTLKKLLALLPNEFEIEIVDTEGKTSLGGNW